MPNSDDEDAYLYGSDAEQPATKKARTEQLRLSELLDSEESSDEDIEFVIGNVPAAAPSRPAVPEPEPNTPSTTEGDSEPAKKRPTLELRKDDEAPAIDINAVAEYEGKALTQVDLNEIKEKPWRAPGEDISDYFNYGFDELTWTAYCHKQDKTRGEFNPYVVMSKIMGGTGKGTAPFPFPFMPGMPGMPNMPNMANMPGMPGMPIPTMPQGKGKQPQGKLGSQNGSSVPSWQIPPPLGPTGAKNSIPPAPPAKSTNQKREGRYKK
ncbi:Fip1-domain-containing protein [Metschnikowia bicuspidata]|uniref:Pre-mRNA polyadenylation factor FIP1 n=1 Tax=Metschnikowia bicuspidata TaxID=27322 RepID=A0A4P9ZCY8_9ASCO|nr:Fip1-domain-containing protein [Metschnikowia bicuspidata]